MIKKAYSISMTYDVSDAEKLQAEKSLLCFNHANKLLAIARDHLNVMKTPFKDSGNMPPEEVMQARAAIRRFRDKALDNFTDFKRAAFGCVQTMQDFSTDTQTIKLMKSFISSIDDLENEVNSFADLFNNLEDKEFAPNVVKKIEGIQSLCDSIEEIIEDRIKKHIQSNILASSWIDSVGNDLEAKIDKKTPLLVELFNKRQDQLSDIIKDRNALGE